MSVRKSFLIFISIVILSIAGVLVFSIDSTTFDVLKNADACLLLCCFLLVFSYWCMEAVKIICLAKAVNQDIPFRRALSVILVNYFGCAITPMQSGGGPFQVYVMYKNGIAVGKSVAITLVRTIEVIAILALLVPFALAAEPEFLDKHFMIKWFVAYVIGFISIMLVVLSISVFRPKMLKKVGRGFVGLMRWTGIIKKQRLFCVVRYVYREIDNYSMDIKMFLSSGKQWFALSFLITGLNLLIYLSIMPCLILSVGYPVEYFQCILAEALFIFLLYFVPTPGASGAAEGGAAAVLGLFVPWNLAGVMAVAWRLISEYTGIAVGTVIVLKTLGWGGVDKVMKATKECIDNESKD